MLRRRRSPSSSSPASIDAPPRLVFEAWTDPEHLCPACIATAALIAAGATSAGGLTALAMKKMRVRTGTTIIDETQPEASKVKHILDFYAQPGVMTSAGGYAPLFDALPRDMAGLVRIVQGLLLHEHSAPAYGVMLSDERKTASHVRPLERMLERLLALDGQPLSVARPVETRLVGVCRHFAVLLVALLRAQGVPARARCGFGSYFKGGCFYDHWVCEYRHPARACWVRVDAQIDDVQRAMLTIDFEVLDVPHDRFLIAGDAWAQYRAGEVDPSAFGIFDIRGLWFIAGNLVRDLAALNNMELLPWDQWGAMPGPDEPLQERDVVFFDRIAALTRAPDAVFTELRALYESDDRVRVPVTVRNALLNREEAI